MPASRSSLRKSALKNQFGIRAERLAIRSELPWYWPAGALLAAFLLGAALMFLYQYMQAPLDDQIMVLRSELKASTEELARLKSEMGTAPNALLMAESAQQTLAGQLEKTQAEAARLREELAYCERINKRDGSVAARTPGTISQPSVTK